MGKHIWSRDSLSVAVSDILRSLKIILSIVIIVPIPPIDGAKCYAPVFM